MILKHGFFEFFFLILAISCNGVKQSDCCETIIQKDSKKILEIKNNKSNISIDFTQKENLPKKLKLDDQNLDDSDKCHWKMNELENKMILSEEEKQSNCAKEILITSNYSFSRFDLKSHQGDIKVQNFKGDSDLFLGAGNLVANGSFDNLKVKLGSASAIIKGINGEATIQTGSGELTAYFNNSPGNIKVKLGSSNAKLFFSKDAKLSFNFITGSGEINSEFIVDDAANINLEIESGSGKVELKKY